MMLPNNAAAECSMQVVPRSFYQPTWQKEQMLLPLQQYKEERQSTAQPKAAIHLPSACVCTR